MNEMRFHLAQANVARAIAALEDPVMSGFVEQLEHINELADRSAGFVWRLQEEHATVIHAFDDARIVFNMSVWESVEALREYVYRSDHRQPMRERRRWFERLEGPHLVLWWISAGHIPTVAEAIARLELLRSRGPSLEAFTFQQAYRYTGKAFERARRDEGASCDG